MLTLPLLLCVCDTNHQALKNAQKENLSLLKDAENYDQRLADVKKAKAEVDEELRLMEKKVVDAGTVQCVPAPPSPTPSHSSLVSYGCGWVRAG